jgi:hypothetical protein
VLFVPAPLLLAPNARFEAPHVDKPLAGAVANRRAA